MQVKHSLLLVTLLFSSQAVAEDYITTQLLYYDEDLQSTKVVSPSLEVNLDFGADYTLNSKFSIDSVSGASAIYYDRNYDVSSGASPYRHNKSNISAFARGDEISAGDIGYGLVDYYDIRFAGSIALTKRLINRDEVTTSFSYSNEYDYHIPEVSLSYLRWLDSSKNSSIEGSFAYQRANVLVWCRQNSQCDTNSGASEIFKQYVTEAQITYSKVIDNLSLANISFFGFKDRGYLSNQYFNVVRSREGKIFIENEVRPDNRTAYGMKIGYKRAVTDKLTFSGSYRYYQDSWEIDSSTIAGEVYYEYNNKFTFEGALRYYKQSSADFYSKRSDYFTTQKYASSDERLGELNSINYTIGVDYKNGLGLNNYFILNYYKQNNGTKAYSGMLGQKYSF